MIKIAIRGSKIYGQAVIRALETLGGINHYYLDGSCEETYYWIEPKRFYIEQQDIFILDDGDQLWLNEHLIFNDIGQFVNNYCPFFTGDKVLFEDCNETLPATIYRLVEENSKSMLNCNTYYLITLNNGLQRTAERDKLTPSIEYKQREVILQGEKEKHYKLSGEVHIKLPDGYKFDQIIYKDNSYYAVCIPEIIEFPSTVEEAEQLLGTKGSGSKYDNLILLRNAWWKLLKFEPENLKPDDRIWVYSRGKVRNSEVRICKADLWKFPTLKSANLFLDRFDTLINDNL